MTLASLRGWIRCHPTAVTVIGSLVVAAALVIGLWDKRGDFGAGSGTRRC